MQKHRLFCCGVFLWLMATTSWGQDYVLERLPENINSITYDEIAPCVSRDGKTLYFTRIAFPDFETTLVENGQQLHKQLDENQYQQKLSQIYSEIAGKPVQNPRASIFNQDIWIAHSINSNFDLIEHPGYPLNNALPNSVSALTPADDPIIINQFNPNGGMRKGFSEVRKQTDGHWDFPSAIGIDRYHNSGPDVNLSMSSDGQVMIIAMEREDSFGESDLYISFRRSDSSWTYPRNLGRGVNSPYRESTPHLSEDMKTLYFSSDRTRPGRGSDIYVQTRLDEAWEQWWAPKRFRSPINSDGDDSHPYFNPATGYLYFTSDRAGTSDIYRIQITKPKAPTLLASDRPRLTKGSKLQFHNIYFVQSKPKILPRSVSELQRLYQLLVEHPQLRILIAGHTDNVGEPNSLQRLSEERAQAIKDYLVKEKGISAARLEVIGHGARFPLNDNSTEARRKQNRRVEITVLESVNTYMGMQMGSD